MIGSKTDQKMEQHSELSTNVATTARWQHSVYKYTQ